MSHGNVTRFSCDFCGAAKELEGSHQNEPSSWVRISVSRTEPRDVKVLHACNICIKPEQDTEKEIKKDSFFRLIKSKFKN